MKSTARRWRKLRLGGGPRYTYDDSNRERFFDPKIARLAAMHADVNFKHLPPRQPAQTLSDLWEAGLVLLLCGISTLIFSQSFFHSYSTSEFRKKGPFGGLPSLFSSSYHN
jgi:hypothetical protein